MSVEGTAGESGSCSVIVDLEPGKTVGVMNLNPGASYPAMYNSFYGTLLYRKA